MRLTLRVADRVTEMAQEISRRENVTVSHELVIFIVIPEKIGYILSDLTMVFQKGRLRLELLYFL